QNRDDFNLGFADDWGTNIITYVKLTPTALPEEAQKALNIAMKSNLPAADLANRTIELNPLDDYYLLTNQASVKKMIVALSVIALFILIIANVNFINITLAASLSRIKEIGVRKVIGGFKTQVILQFLMEAQFLTFTAGFVSLIVYQLFYPYIGELLQTALPSILDLPSSFWVVLILSLLLVGFSAGFYPAVWFSSAKAIYALKGKLQSMKGTLSISQGLMAIQFIIAAFVFTAALVVSIQVSHLTEVSLGYNSTGVLTVSSLPRMWNAEGLAKMETARTAFESLPQIESASLSWGAPNYNFDPYSAKINKAGEPLDVGILTTLSATDQKYADVYGLQLLSGKFFFDKEGVFIPNQLVINETLQNALSLEVGDKVRVQFSTNEFTVAGIMKDFHYESLHTKMKPVALTHTRDFG
ncbi:MAG: ABC transporter permease, partial [Cytophagales bacterium]